MKLKNAAMKHFGTMFSILGDFNIVGKVVIFMPVIYLATALTLFDWLLVKEKCK